MSSPPKKGVEVETSDEINCTTSRSFVGTAGNCAVHWFELALEQRAVW